MGECLRSLQGMVRGTVAPELVVEGIVALQGHVERLFLLALLADLPGNGGGGAGGVGGGSGSRVGRAQDTQGVAFLAMLFSLSWAVSLGVGLSGVQMGVWRRSE